MPTSVQTFNNLLSSATAEEIVKYVTENKSNPKLFKVLVTRSIDHLLNENNTDSALEIFKLTDITPPITSDLSFGVLMLRYLTQINDISNALELYKTLLAAGKTRKRHLQIIIEKLISRGMNSEAYDLYMTYMLDNYTVDSSDIEPFLSIESDPEGIVQKILDTVVGQPIYVDPTKISSSFPEFEPPYCPNSEKLQKLPLTTSDMEFIYQVFSDLYAKKGKTKAYESLTAPDSPNFTYVIDGANVLYHNNCGNIDINSYMNLDAMIQHLLSEEDSTVQLVLHQRHYKKQPNNIIKIQQHWARTKRLFLEKTPYGMNDDWYAIISAIMGSNTYLITNDKFRDHIFKLSKKKFNLDIIGQWRKERVIEYSIMTDSLNASQRVVKFISPVSYSTRIQKVGDNFMVPLTTDKWIMI